MGKPVEIDEDLLRAAERIAAETDTTPGRVISDFARQAMSGQLTVDDLPIRDGRHYLPKWRGVVTPELVDKLDQDEICPPGAFNLLGSKLETIERVGRHYSSSTFRV